MTKCLLMTYTCTRDASLRIAQWRRSHVLARPGLFAYADDYSLSRHDLGKINTEKIDRKIRKCAQTSEFQRKQPEFESEATMLSAIAMP